jgi:hypothetical protein
VSSWLKALQAVELDSDDDDDFDLELVKEPDCDSDNNGSNSDSDNDECYEKRRHDLQDSRLSLDRFRFRFRPDLKSKLKRHPCRNHNVLFDVT